MLSALRDNVAGVLLGKPEVVQLALVALLAEGHLLIEDVPGVGKTLLAKALARSLACSFHRIQFTPDLLPSDLLGVSVYNQSAGAFVFQPGPLFAQVVLADEINRATPRTQSALLEAMSERQVSLDGQTRPLGPPFFVLATQNPFEFEGTYPLPESQLDRFLMRLRIGYPDRDAEKRVLSGHRDGEPVDRLEPVLSVADLTQLQERTRQVRVDDSLADYLLDLIDAHARPPRPLPRRQHARRPGPAPRRPGAGPGRGPRLRRPRRRQAAGPAGAGPSPAAAGGAVGRRRRPVRRGVGRDPRPDARFRRKERGMANDGPTAPARGERSTRLPILLLPWSLAAAFVLLIGWFRNINLLVLLGYLLAAVPLLNLLAAAWPLRGLRARRRIARPIYAGVPCAVSVRVAPTSGRVRLGVRIEDTGPDHRLSWFVGRLEREGNRCAARWCCRGAAATSGGR